MTTQEWITMARKITNTTEIGRARLEYLRDSDGGEGAHRVVWANCTLTVMPDGHTSAQTRSKTISEELNLLSHGLADDLIAVRRVVGALVMAGARNLQWETPDGMSELTGAVTLEAEEQTVGGMLSIGHLPNRKRPALWMVEDGGLRVLAYFIDEASAEAALEGLG